MTLSMYQAAMPTFLQMLGSLSGVLTKADSFAAERKIEPAVLLGYRLAPDMWPLTRQVQAAGDFAKNTAARLAGQEPPKWEDNETSFPELQARIARTVAFVNGFTAAQIDGSETRAISIPLGGKPATFTGQDYLLRFALPNFYFHCATAYDLLRHAGMPLGKRDFLGKFI